MQKEIEKVFNPDTSKEELLSIVKENPDLTLLAILTQMFNYDKLQTNE